MASWIARFGPSWDLGEIAQVLADSADRWRVDPKLIVAVGAVESHWDLFARGRDGERGPLQVKPATFYGLGGKDIHNWRETLSVGVECLALMLARARGDLPLALAYYNAGPSRGEEFARRITRRYVSRVLSHYEQLAGDCSRQAAGSVDRGRSASGFQTSARPASARSGRPGGPVVPLLLHPVYPSGEG